MPKILTRLIALILVPAVVNAECIIPRHTLTGTPILLNEQNPAFESQALALRAVEGWRARPSYVWQRTWRYGEYLNPHAHPLALKRATRLEGIFSLGFVAATVIYGRMHGILPGMEAPWAAFFRIISFAALSGAFPIVFFGTISGRLDADGSRQSRKLSIGYTFVRALSTIPVAALGALALAPNRSYVITFLMGQLAYLLATGPFMAMTPLSLGAANLREDTGHRLRNWVRIGPFVIYAIILSWLSWGEFWILILAGIAAVAALSRLVQAFFDKSLEAASGVKPEKGSLRDELLRLAAGMVILWALLHPTIRKSLQDWEGSARDEARQRIHQRAHGSPSNNVLTILLDPEQSRKLPGQAGRDDKSGPSLVNPVQRVPSRTPPPISKPLPQLKGPPNNPTNSTPLRAGGTSKKDWEQSYTYNPNVHPPDEQPYPVTDPFREFHPLPLATLWNGELAGTIHQIALTFGETDPGPVKVTFHLFERGVRYSKGETTIPLIQSNGPTTYNLPLDNLDSGPADPDEPVTGSTYVQIYVIREIPGLPFIMQSIEFTADPPPSTNPRKPAPQKRKNPLKQNVMGAGLQDVKSWFQIQYEQLNMSAQTAAPPAAPAADISSQNYALALPFLAEVSSRWIAYFKSRDLILIGLVYGVGAAYLIINWIIDHHLDQLEKAGVIDKEYRNSSKLSRHSHWTAFGIPIEIDEIYWLSLVLPFAGFLNFFPVSTSLSLQAMEQFIYAGMGAILLTVSLLAHEMGHAKEAVRLGIGIRVIRIIFLSGFAMRARLALTPEEEWKVAAAGPLVTAALIVLFGAPLLFIPTAFGLHTVLRLVFLTNIGILIWNLFPAFPLDGGRIVKALFWKATKNEPKAIWLAVGSSALLSISVGIWSFLHSRLTLFDPYSMLFATSAQALIALAVFLMQTLVKQPPSNHATKQPNEAA